MATITEDKDQPAQATMIGTPSEVKQASDERLEKLFNKLDLSGIDEWVEEDQQQFRGLIGEYAHLFVSDNLNLQKTSLVKHKIKLTDNTLLKSRDQRIPPQQFDEVKNHLQ